MVGVALSSCCSIARPSLVVCRRQFQGSGMLAELGAFKFKFEFMFMFVLLLLSFSFSIDRRSKSGNLPALTSRDLVLFRFTSMLRSNFRCIATFITRTSWHSRVIENLARYRNLSATEGSNNLSCSYPPAKLAPPVMLANSFV